MTPNEVHYVQVNPSGALPIISQWAPFKAVVAIDADYDVEWQARASKWLVESGCVYMMAWGPNCESWDESVDLANLEQFDFGDIPDEQYVLTSWHDDEPLKELLWSVQISNQYLDVHLAHTLIVHICREDKGDELLKLYAAAGRGAISPTEPGASASASSGSFVRRPGRP
jgi:hypothetical protein